MSKQKSTLNRLRSKESTNELISLIDTETKRFTSNDLKDRVVPRFTELLGSPNYRKSNDPEGLQKALEFIKSVE